MMRVAILLFWILTTLCVAIQAQSAFPAQRCVEARAPVDVAEDRAVLNFSLGGSQYRITAKGRGFRAHSPEPQRFILKRSEDEYMTRVIACQTGNDLVIAAETFNGEDGGGYVYRLNGTSLVTQWRQDIPAFNLASPVLDGATAYISGAGFIGAIDLVWGKYRWSYSGLYADSPAHNGFRAAVVQDDVVLFQEQEPRDSEIAVRKETGEILRPADLKERVKTQGSRRK